MVLVCVVMVLAVILCSLMEPLVALVKLALVVSVLINALMLCAIPLLVMSAVIKLVYVLLDLAVILR